MKRKKRWLGWILVAAACVCAVLAVTGYLKEKNAGSENQAVRNAVVREESEAEGVPDSAESEQKQTPDADSGDSSETGSASGGVAAEAVPVDFAALRKLCPDAYAWIRIDGTDVDYPIVQAVGDQSYYLTHSAEQKRSAAGAIYTENLNSKDFTDPVTVIYGHNMKNGSMFRTLHRYEDRAFFNEHREITVYLPQKALHFRIFAAYNTDDRHILKSYDFSHADEYQSYLDSVFSKRSMSSIVADDISVTTEDRIIILSTCNGISDQRYLVQAVELQP